MNFIDKHPIYKNYLSTIFLKQLIKNGYKNYSELILKKIFNIIIIIKKNPLFILEHSIKNIKLNFKYIINNKYTIISNIDSVKLAVKWLLSLFKKKKKFFLYKNLAYEILKLYNKESFLINKKLNYIKNYLFIILYKFINKKKIFNKFKYLNKKKFFINKLNYIKSFY